jgi:polygalacturonase
LNTPWDDAICLKASYGLGRIQHCENITISDCMVSGNFDEGSVIDGTFKRSKPEYRSGRYGRIPGRVDALTL